MNTGGDVAEQVVRFYLEGFEVIAKLSGKGAEHAISALLNVLAQQEKTKGKARLNTMLKKEKNLSIFTITKKDLKTFSREAKRYGVLYCTLMRKFDKNKDGIVDILVKQDDSPKINRIVERFNLIVTNETNLKTEIENEKNKEIVITNNSFDNNKENKEIIITNSSFDNNKEKKDNNLFNNVIEKLKEEELDKSNFKNAEIAKSPLSKHYSTISKEIKGEKESVKEKLKNIKADMNNKKRAKHYAKNSKIQAKHYEKNAKSKSKEK